MQATATKLRAIVVDDSSLYRKIVRDVLGSMPDVEVVATAHDGVAALDRIETLKPDLVALDLEMPRLDGLGVLRELSARGIDCVTIMISAFTTQGAESTTEALKEGAFDFILKPTTKAIDESISQLRADLSPKLIACRGRLTEKQARRLQTPHQSAPRGPARAKRQEQVDIVGIAISTGGPHSLTSLLPRFPSDFPCPIVIVQHMPPLFTKSLADDLDRHCQLSVREGSEGMKITPGTVTIAPGGHHMEIVDHGFGPEVHIQDDPPERNCRPAADVMFRSLSKIYGSHALGVVMTGMGDDGTAGAKLLSDRGATIIAQDAASCVVNGMPQAVVDAGLADRIVSLENMSSQVITLARTGR